MSKLHDEQNYSLRNVFSIHDTINNSIDMDIDELVEDAKGASIKVFKLLDEIEELDIKLDYARNEHLIIKKYYPELTESLEKIIYYGLPILCIAFLLAILVVK